MGSRLLCIFGTVVCRHRQQCCQSSSLATIHPLHSEVRLAMAMLLTERSTRRPQTSVSTSLTMRCIHQLHMVTLNGTSAARSNTSGIEDRDSLLSPGLDETEPSTQDDAGEDGSERKLTLSTDGSTSRGLTGLSVSACACMPAPAASVYCDRSHMYSDSSKHNASCCTSKHPAPSSGSVAQGWQFGAWMHVHATMHAAHLIA